MAFERTSNRKALLAPQSAAPGLRSTKTKRAKRFISHVDSICPETERMDECSHDQTFNLNGLERSPKSFLAKLMSLPDPVRDHIYELVISVPARAPAWWLRPDGSAFAPDVKLYIGAEAQSWMPTLESKNGLWCNPQLKNGWGNPHRWPFCQTQGFAEALSKLALAEIAGAKECLEDFKKFVSERTVLQVDNYYKMDWYIRPEPSLWFRHLGTFMGHLKHLFVELSSQDVRDERTQHLRGSKKLETGCQQLDAQGKRVPQLLAYKGSNRVAAFVELCDIIRTNMPKLQSLFLLLQLSQRQINNTINHPEQQRWFQACKSIAVEDVEVGVRYINPVPRFGEDRSTRYFKLGKWPDYFYSSAEDVDQARLENAYSMLDVNDILWKMLVPGRKWELTDDVPYDLGLKRLFGDGIEVD